MSWCRWSTDIDNKCTSDLYIYDSVNDCITVHIAGRRRANYKHNPYRSKSPSEYNLKDENWTEQFIEHNKKRNQWFDDHEEWENLPEAYAGKNYDFGYEDLDSLTEFLHQARKDGINFPDYCFECAEEYENEQ